MAITKLSTLCNEEFTVNNFTVSTRLITPPVPFICKKGDVLWERFFYVVNGTISFDLPSGDTLVASKNDIVYLPYDTTYTSHWDTASTGEFISLNFVLKNALGEIISISDKIDIITNDYMGIYLKTFTELKDNWHMGALGFKLKCKSILFNLIYDFTISSEKSNLKNTYSKIYKSILYLENNYINAVSTRELARISNINECTFRNLFKEATGVTPTQYKNNLRIKKACEILETGEYNVSETMLLTGFDDPHYFNKTFKKYTGHNPSYYLKKNFPYG